jgi:phospholipase/carboxylesterase
METCEFDLSLKCRYLLSVPEKLPETPAIVLTLHGYGSNPETMLRLTGPTVAPGVIVAALQGPNQQYAAPDGPAGGVAGYNWGIRQHHAEVVVLHHTMVHTVLAELQRRFGTSPRRCFLMGFSQAVGLNYRFIGTYPDSVGGIIAICGGVPKDWESSDYQSFSTPILAISRSEDEFFPTAVSAGFPDRLRVHASDVEFHMIAGKHRYPSSAKDLVRPWMARVLAM